MRKYYLCIFALILALVFCSCAIQQAEVPDVQQPATDPPRNDIPSDKTENPEASEISEADPDYKPEPLEFHYMEELEIFLASTTREDEDFQKYLHEQKYDLSKIDDKKDVEDLKAKLKNVPFPSVADAELQGFYILTHNDSLYFVYKLSSGDNCAVTVSYGSEYRVSSTDVTEETILSAEKIKFSTNLTPSKGQTWLDGTVNGCSIVFRMKGTEDEARSVLNKNLTFSVPFP